MSTEPLRAQRRQIPDGRSVRPRDSQERITVHSAGSAPGEHLNPAVVEVMREKGIDIADERPQKLTDEMTLSADVMVTMGCGDACPVYPGTLRRLGTHRSGRQAARRRPANSRRRRAARHALIDELLAVKN
jgi:arsenate reductase